MMLQNKNILTEFIFQNFNTVKSIDTDIVKQHNIGNKILNVINKVRSFYTFSIQSGWKVKNTDISLVLTINNVNSYMQLFWYWTEIFISSEMFWIV